ncbi:MAG: hypothetical protein QNJ65_00235 [Xenococcaceae cyanobacterium MO_234.B1]|nr:hypothetical protein [Xenococcaceae cyanobacterium MO_234.B1]
MSDKFYTFYDFTNNNGYPPFKPLVQYQLKKRIERLAKLHPEWKEPDYVQYFGEILLNKPESDLESPFAHWHFLAYLDLDRCYLIWRNFHHFPFYAAKSEDFYALTNEILCQPQKLKIYLAKYNPQNEKKASVKTYILSILKNSIRENIDLQSDWHLLCNVDVNSLRKLNNFGQKLRKALVKYGLREPKISQYIFAWQYFVPVYKNNRVYNFAQRKNQRWPEPGNSDFAEAANYYNTQRFQPDAPLQVSSGKELTSEMLKKWMNICIEALRQAEEIIEISRDADIYERQEEQIDNWIVLDLDCQDEESDSLEQVEIILRQEIKKIETNFDRIKSRIPQQLRRAIMPLCYANRLAILNQEQLASLLGVHQGTISRYISKYIEVPLLNRLRDLLIKKFDFELYLDTFLSDRFANPHKESLLDGLLLESLKELDNKKQYILKLRYGQKMTLKKIKLKINSEKNINEDDISEIKNELRRLFQEKFNKWQTAYIKFWLINHNKNLIQGVLLNGFKQLTILNQEILKKRYCQKIDEKEIMNLYPKCSVSQIIYEAKQQLQEHLLQWIKNHLGIDLISNNLQVRSVIDDWLLTALIYLEI